MPIATSKIVAQSFRLMEISPITNFDVQSEQVLAVTDQYEEALDACLEECDWSFARRLATLSPVDEPANDPDLPYHYTRPADCLMIRKIGPGEMCWRLDPYRIRTDAGGDIHIRYTFQLREEETMSASFRVAVAYRLASFLAPRWTTSINRADGLYKKSDQYIGKAMRLDRRSSSPSRYDGRSREGWWQDVATR